MESEKTAAATAPARRRVAKVPAHPVALVTGASGDLGGAMAQTLARVGMAVWVHANSQLAKAQALAAQINADADTQAAGGRAEAIAFDIRDNAACRTAAQQMLAQGPVQVVVHNAGVTAACKASNPLCQAKGIINSMCNAPSNKAQWCNALSALNGWFKVGWVKPSRIAPTCLLSASGMDCSWDLLLIPTPLFVIINNAASLPELTADRAGLRLRILSTLLLALASSRPTPESPTVA